MLRSNKILPNRWLIFDFVGFSLLGGFFIEIRFFILKATEKKSKNGCLGENGYWLINNGGVRVENILHERASSSTNYEAIWRSSFLIRSYICEFHDLRLLVWTFGSSSMRTCQKEFILSYLS